MADPRDESWEPDGWGVRWRHDGRWYAGPYLPAAGHTPEECKQLAEDVSTGHSKLEIVAVHLGARPPVESPDAVDAITKLRAEWKFYGDESTTWTTALKALDEALTRMEPEE